MAGEIAIGDEMATATGEGIAIATAIRVDGATLGDMTIITATMVTIVATMATVSTAAMAATTTVTRLNWIVVIGRGSKLVRAMDEEVRVTAHSVPVITGTPLQQLIETGLCRVTTRDIGNMRAIGVTRETTAEAYLDVSSVTPKLTVCHRLALAS